MKTFRENSNSFIETILKIFIAAEQAIKRLSRFTM